MGKVTFVDETAAGERSAGWGIEVPEGRLALRELIRRRVEREVAEVNDGAPAVFRALVRPEGAVRVPGGFAFPAPRRIDVAALALRAFAGNGFLVLVGDRQITGLDETVDVSSGAEVTFLRLVALVGG